MLAIPVELRLVILLIHVFLTPLYLPLKVNVLDVSIVKMLLNRFVFLYSKVHFKLSVSNKNKGISAANILIYLALKKNIN